MATGVGDVISCVVSWVVSGLDARGLTPFITPVLIQGITTLEEVAKQPGLTNAQRVGLKYATDLTERIPREEVDQLRDRVRKHRQTLLDTSSAVYN